MKSMMEAGPAAHPEPQAPQKTRQGMIEEVTQRLKAFGRLVVPPELAPWEAACRARVSAAPDDLAARGDLAWCLLMRVLYTAGVDAAGVDMAEVDTTGLFPAAATRPCSGAGSPHGARTRASEPALRECLRHALAAQRLSTDAWLRQDMERLRFLVGLWEEGALVQAEDAADARRDRLLRDISRDASAAG